MTQELVRRIKTLERSEPQALEYCCLYLIDAREGENPEDIDIERHPERVFRVVRLPTGGSDSQAKRGQR